MDWARFDEASVLKERRQSVARTQKAKDLVNKQEAVLQGILQKLVEEDSGFGGGSPTASDGFSRTGSTRFRPKSERLEQWPEGDSTFSQQTWIVANKIMMRQEKTEKFHRQRRKNMEEERQRQQARHQERLQAEERFAMRRAQLVDEQRRKAFAAQQRRLEQQKVFRDFEQDKNLSDERRTLAAPTRPSSPTERPEEEEEDEEEDIYKHMLKSHNLYSETMERWRHQIADGSRGGRALARESGFLRRSKSSSFWSASGEHKRMSATTSFSPLNSPSSAKEKMSRSMPCLRRSTTEVWKERFEAVQRHEQDRELQALRKEKEDQERLEGGRRRIAALNQEVMQKATHRARQWHQRNDAAASRRMEGEFSSDAEMVDKLKAGALRKADLEQRRQARMAELAAKKQSKIHAAQAQAAFLLENQSKATLARAEQRDQMLSERHAMRLAEFAARADLGSPSHVHAEEAKNRKKKLEEDFRAKARKEIEMKDRPPDLRPVLEKQRTMKRTRTAKLLTSSSSLPEIASPAGA